METPLNFVYASSGYPTGSSGGKSLNGNGSNDFL